MKGSIAAAVALIAISVLPGTSESRLAIPDIKNHRESVLEVHTGDGLMPTEATSPLNVSFTAYRKRFVLKLSPSHVISATTKTYIVDDSGRREVPTVNRSFFGAVENDPESIVRVTLMRGALIGRIQTGGVSYRIAPRASFDGSGSSDSIVIYRERDNPVRNHECGQEQIEPDDGPILEQGFVHQNTAAASNDSYTAAPDFSGRIRLTPTNQLKQIQLGVLADYDFVSVVHGGNADAAELDMVQAINEADGFTRGSTPSAKGSVPLALQVGAIVSYATRAAQISDGLTLCPLTCSVSGLKCTDNNDCSGGGGTCEQVPKGTELCRDGAKDGQACTAHTDCPDGKCQSTFQRAGSSAGILRVAGTTGITTSNTGTVHRFSGCRLYAGASAPNDACHSTGSGSWSVTQHWQGSTETATNDVGVFAHEFGHSLSGGHDSDDGDCGSLLITKKACLSGADVGLMCDSNNPCAGGASCTLKNERECAGGGSGSNDGEKCLTNADCDGTCDGPENHLCVGGTNDGEYCNVDYVSMCANQGGTCTGAPMNWDIYPLGGSGTYGGYSPCSRDDINAFLDGNPGCLATINCGDVNRSTGAITIADALAAYTMSSSGAYDDLADVYPDGSPDGIVDDDDADHLLGVAVGSITPAPTICGEADVW